MALQKTADTAPASAVVVAAGQGVQLLRVHDVSETRQALAIKEALQCSF